MNELESLEIKRKFDEQISKLTKKDAKEYDIKLNLIFSLFFLALIFSTITTYITLKNYNRVKAEQTDVKDIVNVKVYIGSTNRHYVIRPAVVNKIYDKGKYIMALCNIKTKNGYIYHTCVTQVKQNLALYY